MNHELAPDRRHSLRQRVNTPAFASFDGVTGGMVLDLSEEGMAMQTLAPLDAHSIVPLHLSLGEPAAYLETTGYVAWADALGRAGVRFSELPDEARARLREWLTANAYTPSWKAPRWVVSERAERTFPSGIDRADSGRRSSDRAKIAPAEGHGLERPPVHNFCQTESALDVKRVPISLSLEADPGNGNGGMVSTTVQYEFKSLGGDLNSALKLIASRACSITRGSGAAVALAGESGMTCRATAGTNVPPVGVQVDVNAGFTGECIRLARALRCDDAYADPRADTEACRRLGIRSILAAPVLYERDLVGLLEVFCTRAFAFDDGDLAVVERMAQTVVLTLSRAEAFRSSGQ